MKHYNSFKELHDDYADRFGRQWDRCDLTEEQEWEWVNSCYELYQKQYNKRDVVSNVFDDKYDGRQFVILSPITNTETWDLECLPAYNIKFTDNNEVWQAYPEEIFDCD